MKRELIIPFDAPLHSDDSESQTFGCRKKAPDNCINNGIVNVCAFMREDCICKCPSRKWNSQFLRLKYASVDNTKAIGIDVLLKKKGITAKGKIFPNSSFLLIAGSQISPSVSDTCPSRALIKRKECIASGIIRNCILIEDVLFQNSSCAASFVVGYSISGPKTWKKQS